MLLRVSSTRKVYPRKKNINFSAILSKDYFNNNIIKIQMALNKNRILPLDYLIRRTKSKINTGVTLRSKKHNEDNLSNSYHNHLDKRKIPEELEKILVENEQKFLVQNEQYFNLKNENDKSLGFWHYIQAVNNKKKNKEIFFKKFIDDTDNKINLNSNKIQEMAKTMFKISPLLITKEKIDIFFYYLGEFNKYFSNQKKYDYIKKKVITFLKNLKEFLDYIEIKADSNVDSIAKEIKLKNSKFIKRINTRIKQELKSMLIKEKQRNKTEIKSAKKMITNTKKTLDSLNKDKMFFEDPAYFDPNYSPQKNKKYKFKSRNILHYKQRFNLSSLNYTKDINTCNMNQTNKMSTASTGFFFPEKKGEKNYKMIPKAESCKNREDIIIEDSNLNFKKIKINQQLINKRINSALNLPKNKIILKANTIKSKKSRNISVEKTENKKNSEKNSMTSSFYNNTRKNFFNANLKVKSTINSMKKNDEESSQNLNFISQKNIKMTKSGETPIIKINKNILKKKTFNDIQTFKFNNKNYSDVDIRLQRKRQKTSIAPNNVLTYKNKNSNDFNSNDGSKSKLKLIKLYEGLKTGNRINYFDIADINSYFSQKGKKIKSNLRLMDIILHAKNSMHKYDIEHKTKKISQTNFTSEQNDKLMHLKDINNQIESLHTYYMNNIFDYKSKILCENNQIKV